MLDLQARVKVRDLSRKLDDLARDLRFATELSEIERLAREIDVTANNLQLCVYALKEIYT